MQSQGSTSHTPISRQDLRKILNDALSYFSFIIYQPNLQIDIVPRKGPQVFHRYEGFWSCNYIRRQHVHDTCHRRKRKPEIIKARLLSIDLQRHCEIRVNL